VHGRGRELKEDQWVQGVAGRAERGYDNCKGGVGSAQEK
jgi:hypothetical protein